MADGTLKGNGEQEQKQERVVIKIGAGDRKREVDLTNLPPFTLGDRKRLMTEFKVDFKKGLSFSPEDDINLTFYIIRSVDPTVTIEEVENLPTLVGQDVVFHSVQRSQEVDRPFLKRSTSSPPTTGGD